LLSEFLRYSRYSSCGRDKLSEASGFYLRGCKVAVLLFYPSAFVVSRVIFEFCAAFGALVAMRITLHSSCAVGIEPLRASRLHHGACA